MMKVFRAPLRMLWRSIAPLRQMIRRKASDFLYGVYVERIAPDLEVCWCRRQIQLVHQLRIEQASGNGQVTMLERQLALLYAAMNQMQCQPRPEMELLLDSVTRELVRLRLHIEELRDAPPQARFRAREPAA